jgi:oligo-1,6-glucosidase/alpha-glucosidase
MDANGDGIGDIEGIISRLDYLKDMGFETIWFSPLYQSPQQDFGYDISDYRDIAPEYGDLDAARRLIREVHARGMKILFDMVLDHTSIQHPWFIESRSSRSNPKRDWYIWRDGKGRNGKRPPNNWKAITGKSGWQYDEHTQQWFYCNFLNFQPDLNFHNPEVKQAMLENVRFWLDLGLDGFRLDLFHATFKDKQFRDNPFSWRYAPTIDTHEGFFQTRQRTANLPETAAFAKELRALADSYQPERLLIGEVFGKADEIRQHLGEQHDGLQQIFLFELLRFRIDAAFFRNILRNFEHQYPAPFVPSYVYGNHDQRRSISRIGEDPQKAKLLALFQLTVRGVPTIYYGEEIGMRDAALPCAEGLDPIARQYKAVPRWLTDALDLYINRDGCRTPMQWDASANAGFSPEGSKTWLPLNTNYQQVNVAAQLADPHSLLHCYKALLRIRRSKRAILDGDIQLLDTDPSNQDLLAFVRQCAEEKILVLINFGPRTVRFNNSTGCTTCLFSTDSQLCETAQTIELPAFSGALLSNQSVQLALPPN